MSHGFEQARELYADVWLGFSELEMHTMLGDSGFLDIDVSVVSREEEAPHLQTLLATARKSEVPPGGGGDPDRPLAALAAAS